MLRYTKDPQDKLDYGHRWQKWLRQDNGTVDVIVSSTWSRSGPDTALTIVDNYFDAQVTGVWLSGGTLNADYRVTNHIVTAAGREADRTMTVHIEEK